MRPADVLKFVFLGALLAPAMAAAPARAAFVATETTNVVLEKNGFYMYSYTIAVAASSTVSASEFDLQLYAPIDPNSIISPSNFFTFYTVGDPFISFTADYNPNGFDGIAPGSTGTFSFVSAAAPGNGSYQTSGLDDSSGSVDAIPGITNIPVPEPSSLLLTVLGASGGLGWFARGRRRADATRG